MRQNYVKRLLTAPHADFVGNADTLFPHVTAFGAIV
jgi:hypothetical protein